jgi:PAS domain S-box-containing protein
MEKELRESEEFSTSLLENSPNPVQVINPDTSIKYVNPAFEKLTGFTAAEYTGIVAPYPWWPEEFRAEITAGQKETILNGASRSSEQVFQKKNGEFFWAALNASTIIDKGNKKYLLINWVDITERKKAEEKHQAILKTALDGFCITDLDGRFLEVNDAYCTMTGYTREELLAMSLDDVDAKIAPEQIEWLGENIAKQGQVRLETQHRCKDGRLIDIEVSSKYPETGEAQVYTFIHDITERKKAEEKLRLLGSVTQQVSDSIMITDPRFRITYVNQAAQDMFGYTFDEIRGKPLATFHVTPPDAETNRKVKEYIDLGNVWYQTIPKKHKDGTIIICDCRLSPLYDEEGKICAYIDVQRDVTQQKEAEAKLEAQRQLIESILATMPEGVLVVDAFDSIILANKSIQQIFHHRQNAIINKLLKDVIPVEPLINLYHRVKLGKKQEDTIEFRFRTRNIDKIITCGAVKMDEERTLLTFIDISRERAEKEKLYLTDRLASIGEMAVGLAHELNNPLTGILSLSQMLIDGDIPPESKEDLQCINSEAKRAATIVKNVLLFTRNNNYEKGQASVNEVVKNVLRLRDYEVKASNINVITNLQPDLPDVQIDQFQLQQVFLNIIINAEAAIKEANRPGILTINTAKSDSYVDVAISDNGCGIKKNILPRIFDPFFTTKEIGKGTGLGLSICYGIISKHGGKINVSTRVKQGTTFTVRIPAVLQT